MGHDTPPGGKPLKRKLLRNTAFNVLGTAWTVLVGLFLTRYIIDAIGLKAFGMWMVMEATVGHFSLADLGIRTSFVKFLSNLYPRGRMDEINEVLSSGALYYTAFGVLILAAGLVVRGPLITFLRIPAELRGDASFVYLVYLVLFAAEHAFRVYGAVLVGLQRMDLSNRIRIYLTLPYAAALWLFIRAGYGLKGVVTAYAIRFALETVVNVIVAHRLLPTLRIGLRRVRWRTFREMLAFGLKLQLIRWEELVIFYTDKLLIAHFLSLSLVSLYELGLRISSRVYEFSVLVDSALVPAVSEADSRGQKELIARIYERGSRYLMAVSAPLLCFTAAAAPVIMRAWMGHVYPEAVEVIRIFILSFLICNVAKISRSICIGINTMSFYLWTSALQVVMNLALSIWLIGRIGFIGVVWATFISLLVDTVVFTTCYHRRFCIPLWPVLRQLIRAYVLGAIIPALALGWFNDTYPAFLSGGIVSLLRVLCLEGIWYLLVYALFLLVSRGFDSYDLAQMRHLIVSLRGGSAEEGKG